MKKFSIAIVDSNYIQRRETLELVDDYIENNHLKAEVEWFNSGPGLLDNIMKRGGYDIYLIEPIMPDMNGIRLANELKRFGCRGKVIYLSTSKTYAYSAFEVRAFDYISKPVNRDRFYSSMDEAIKLIINNTATPMVELQINAGYIRVPVNDISYVDIVDRALCYHMANGEKYTSKCLRQKFIYEVAQFLELPWFVLAGSSRIINVECIEVLRKEAAQMSNGDNVPITKHSYKLVQKTWHESKL